VQTYSHWHADARGQQHVHQLKSVRVYDRSTPERVARRVHAAATRARGLTSVESRVCLRHARLLTQQAQCHKVRLSDMAVSQSSGDASSVACMNGTWLPRSRTGGSHHSAVSASSSTTMRCRPSGRQTASAHAALSALHAAPSLHTTRHWKRPPAVVARKSSQTCAKQWSLLA